MLRFGNHRLDLDDQRLWHGETAIALGPKAFAVLRYLVERAGRLVTKDELLKQVWADTHVGEAVLKTCILEIRKALGDDPRAPRFVETLHRRGYRFLPHPTDAAAAPPATPAPGLCGRASALAEVDAAFARAAAGTRQIVFVTGDAGIGKTTLVDAFLGRVAGDARVLVARGQCHEIFGAGEPYGPVIDALGRACRTPGGPLSVDTLERHAPTWLVQLPALLDPARRAALQRELQGAAGDRMPRELAELVETMTAATSILVLVVEDLHWSDTATLDLLSTLARRREPARLLVLATYRPVDAAVREHPLSGLHHDLTASRLAHDLALDVLGEADVAQYLARTVPRAAAPALARALHRRTDGLPLVLATVVESLIADQRLLRDGDAWRLQAPVEAIEVDIPDGIRRSIERQVDHVPPNDRALLTTASLAGDPFFVSIVAAVLDEDAFAVEERCAALARRSGILRPAGVEELPDGRTSARFAFRHALYRRVLMDGVPAARRVRLSRRIGELTEAAWGDRAAEIAAELAAHFEDGRDFRRAIAHRCRAAASAAARWAYEDALANVVHADTLLRHVADASERDASALDVVMARASTLVALRGYAAPEVRDAFARAQSLCERLPQTPHLLPSLWGLCGSVTVGGDVRTGARLAAQCATIAARTGDDGFRLEAHHVGWVTSYFAGDLVRAERLIEAGLRLYDTERHADHVFYYGQDAGVAAYAYRSLVETQLGRVDAGLASAHAACALADRIGHPLSRVFARHFLGCVHLMREEPDAQRAAADDGFAIAEAHGFHFWVAGATFLRGHALAAGGDGPEGLASMERGLSALRATGTRLALPVYLTSLASQQVRRDRIDDAERVLAEAHALCDETGQEHFRAEVRRLQGEVALRRGNVAAAEAALRDALGLAHRQHALTFELRAATALARALQARRRTPDARKVLAPVLRRAREGRALPTFVAAQAALRALEPARR